VDSQVTAQLPPWPQNDDGDLQPPRKLRNYSPFQNDGDKTGGKDTAGDIYRQAGNYGPHGTPGIRQVDNAGIKPAL